MVVANKIPLRFTRSLPEGFPDTNRASRQTESPSHDTHRPFEPSFPGFPPTSILSRTHPRTPTALHTERSESLTATCPFLYPHFFHPGGLGPGYLGAEPSHRTHRAVTRHACHTLAQGHPGSPMHPYCATLSRNAMAPAHMPKQPSCACQGTPVSST
jgi:hypothetical protein